jgi:putative transposase
MLNRELPAASMPRKPRFYLPGIPVHVVQRGNSRQKVFFRAADYLHYLGWLQEGAARHGCRIHAYVLMTNHVHLLLTPETRESISRAIQYVGRYYVRYVNSRYGKSGTLWEGRHKGCLVSDDRYLLACMRYIEMNPVRAGMVAHPGGYRWSSYRGNAGSIPDTLLTSHGVYQGLGHTLESCARNYRNMFDRPVAPATVDEIRACVQSGTPLGNGRFMAKVERVLQCRTGKAGPGRPRKTAEKGY